MSNNLLEVIIGNICSLGATLSDSYSGTRKTKKGILFSQTVSQIFYLVSSIVLKGYSAAAQNAVAIFRNLYGAREKQSKFLDWFFVILPVVLGIYFNNLGLMGLIPVIANLEYALFLFVFAKDNPTLLKISFAICCVLFMIFNFFIRNIVGGVSCVIISLTTFASVSNEIKNRKKQEGNTKGGEQK